LAFSAWPLGVPSETNARLRIASRKDGSVTAQRQTRAGAGARMTPLYPLVDSPVQIARAALKPNAARMSPKIGARVALEHFKNIVKAGSRRDCVLD